MREYMKVVEAMAPKKNVAIKPEPDRSWLSQLYGKSSEELAELILRNLQKRPRADQLHDLTVAIDNIKSDAREEGAYDEARSQAYQRDGY